MTKLLVTQSVVTVGVDSQWWHCHWWLCQWWHSSWTWLILTSSLKSLTGAATWGLSSRVWNNHRWLHNQSPFWTCKGWINTSLLCWNYFANWIEFTTFGFTKPCPKLENFLNNTKQSKLHKLYHSVAARCIVLVCLCALLHTHLCVVNEPV